MLIGGVLLVQQSCTSVASAKAMWKLSASVTLVQQLSKWPELLPTEEIGRGEDLAAEKQPEESGEGPRVADALLVMTTRTALQVTPPQKIRTASSCSM